MRMYMYVCMYVCICAYTYMYVCVYITPTAPPNGVCMCVHMLETVFVCALSRRIYSCICTYVYAQWTYVHAVTTYVYALWTYVYAL